MREVCHSLSIKSGFSFVSLVSHCFACFRCGNALRLRRRVTKKRYSDGDASRKSVMAMVTHHEKALRRSVMAAPTHHEKALRRHVTKKHYADVLRRSQRVTKKHYANALWQRRRVTEKHYADALWRRRRFHKKALRRCATATATRKGITLMHYGNSDASRKVLPMLYSDADASQKRYADALRQR